MTHQQKLAMISAMLFLITCTVIFSNIKSSLNDFGQDVKSTTKSTVKSIEKGGKETINKIEKTGKKAVDTTVQVGKSTVDVVHIIEALVDKIPNLIKTTKGAIADAKVIENHKLASQKIRDIPLIIKGVQTMLSKQIEPIIHSLVPLMKDVQKPDVAKQIDDACEMIKKLSDALDLLNTTLSLTADAVESFGK